MNSGKKNSRRSFLKTTGLGLGALGTLSSFEWLNSKETPAHNDTLSIYGYDYLRCKAIAEQKIKLEGFDYTFTKSSIGNMNTEMFSGSQKADVSEVGSVPFILAYANDNFRDYSLLPIFPLRVFRHKSIFINRNSGIQKPKDLIGRKIGTPGYSSSSLTWIRGMLKDEYGIDPKDVEWVVSDKDSGAKVAGKVSSQENVIPDGITITKGTKGKDESELLVSGEVDALFHALEPEAFVKGHPDITRLFEDSRKAEQDYYQKTGIFPIMHCVAIKNELLASHPNLAEVVFKAFSNSKAENYKYMHKLAWAFDSLPWYRQEYEETVKLMGPNYYSYGIKGNEKTLEAVCNYVYDQGLAKKKVDYKELFYPPSLLFKE